MGIKEEFEKLPEIKLRLIGMVFCFSKNQYIPKNKIIKEVVIAAKEVNLAWYAFQEQQKKIDALKEKIDSALKLMRQPMRGTTSDLLADIEDIL